MVSKSLKPYSKQQVLHALLEFSKDFSTGCLLTSNGYQDIHKPNGLKLLAGFGSKSEFLFDANNWSGLDAFIQNHKGKKLFVAISYGIKDAVYPKLNSQHKNRFEFPNLLIFEPEHWVEQKEEQLNFSSQAFADVILGKKESESSKLPHVGVVLTGMSKQDYLKQIQKVQDYIQQGDTYELTFCQNFEQEQAQIDPYLVFEALMEKNPSPFACFYKRDQNYLLSASPERFLSKQGDKLFSQPIKGTVRRSKDAEEDLKLAHDLKHSEKDISENVMIVDLVRNDLSRIASKSSVQVDELFGLYSFATVHQLISTISCKLPKDCSFSNILKACFPMGSMTGAPKHNTMKLIDELENFNRSMFSGSVGYINEAGDFDLNVIIRSILYNQQGNYLACPVGGAITIESDPEKEYEECLVKLKAQVEALSSKLLQS